MDSTAPPPYPDSLPGQVAPAPLAPAPEVSAASATAAQLQQEAQAAQVAADQAQADAKAKAQAAAAAGAQAVTANSKVKLGQVGILTLGADHAGGIAALGQALGIGGGHPTEGTQCVAIVTAIGTDAADPDQITVEVFGLADRLVTSATAGSSAPGGFN